MATTVKQIAVALLPHLNGLSPTIECQSEDRVGEAVKINLGDAGFAIWLSGGTYYLKDKVAATAVYPRRDNKYSLRDWYIKGYESSPEVKASLTRSPEAIAKDIARRFMPEFREIMPLVQAKVEELDAYNNAEAAAVAKMAGALGENVGLGGGFYVHNASFRVQRDSVYFDHMPSVSHDQALRILAILGKNDG